MDVVRTVIVAALALALIDVAARTSYEPRAGLHIVASAPAPSRG